MSEDVNNAGEELDNIIILNDEEGNEVKFEFLDLIELDGEEFVVLLPTEEEEDSEEVVIYDYDNKVKRVRLNSRISEAADFKNICVISGVPYNFLESDKGTRIINLNTQKTEYKLPADVCVEYVQDDIIVTSEHVKKMSIFRKENDFVEVFRFPDMHHAIYKTRDKFKGCIKHFDDLLIFVG